MACSYFKCNIFYPFLRVPQREPPSRLDVWAVRWPRAFAIGHIRVSISGKYSTTPYTLQVFFLGSASRRSKSRISTHGEVPSVPLTSSVSSLLCRISSDFRVAIRHAVVRSAGRRRPWMRGLCDYINCFTVTKGHRRRVDTLTDGPAIQHHRKWVCHTHLVTIYEDDDVLRFLLKSPHCLVFWCETNAIL
jgi:hypothetical protein